MFKFYNNIVASVSSFAFKLSMILMLALTLFVIIATAARYLFHSPIPFTVTISGYLMLAIVFFAFAGALMDGHHIKIQVLIHRLPPKIGNISSLAMMILSIWWFICVLIGCWSIWWYFFQNKVMPVSGVMIPLWIPALPLILGSTLLILQLLAEIGKQIESMRKQGKNSQGTPSAE